MISESEPTHESVIQRGRKVAVMAILISLGLFGIMIYYMISDYRFTQQALTVQGTVIEIQVSENSYSDDHGENTTTHYIPVFQYEIRGQSYTQKGKSTTSPGYERGEKVDVLVDPANPQVILVNTFRERWLIPMIFGLAGTVLLGIAWLAKRFGW